MASCLRSLRKPIACIAVVVPFVTLAGCSNSWWFHSILTPSLFLVISTFFFFLKQKPVLQEQSIQEHAFISEEQCSPQVEEIAIPLQECSAECETTTHDKKTEADEAQQVHDYFVTSPDLYSETESTDHSSKSEDSDAYWQFSGNVGQSLDCSNDSISDEESLIEIALPSGHYVYPKEEPKYIIQQKWQNLSQDNIFGQHGLLELFSELSEMNEEENLIEIDISMGSIKCSRFEIEA